MFKKLFSFNGRIRRQEFGITVIIYFLVFIIIQNIIDSSEGSMDFVIIAVFPLYWILIAQGTKRAHDLGDSGWYQLIPFYIFWMLLADSDPGINQYGPNPKGVGNDA